MPAFAGDWGCRPHSRGQRQGCRQKAGEMAVDNAPSCDKSHTNRQNGRFFGKYVGLCGIWLWGPPHKPTVLRKSPRFCRFVWADDRRPRPMPLRGMAARLGNPSLAFACESADNTAVEPHDRGAVLISSLPGARRQGREQGKAKGWTAEGSEGSRPSDAWADGEDPADCRIEGGGAQAQGIGEAESCHGTSEGSCC